MSVRAVEAQRSNRVIQLDFVRGLAILAVMEYHFLSVPVHNPIARAFEFLGKRLGWMGVDFFFVLSGFLVGGLLVQELLKSNDVAIGRFLVRRAMKIWPAYYVYLLFQVIARKHPLGSFFWQNFLNIQNYAGTSLNHTWSLAVEEHFYLVLPPLLWYLFKNYRASIPWVLLSLCGVVLAGRFVTVYALGWGDPQWKTHARIDNLLFGVLLSWFFYSQRAKFDQFLERRVLLSCISIVGLLFAVQQGRHTSIMWTIGYTINYLSLAALLLVIYQYRGALTYSLPYRFVAWIGVYSYGIYLWHLSVREPLAKIVTHLPLSIQWISLLCGQYITAVILGVVMTKLVEFPMLRVRDRVFPRGEARLAPAQP
jgi:peptidoglycan/LPS O-acetylase OafA/YrhL